jgi:hypothetical protein
VCDRCARARRCLSRAAPQRTTRHTVLPPRSPDVRLPRCTRRRRSGRPWMRSWRRRSPCCCPSCSSCWPRPPAPRRRVCRVPRVACSAHTAAGRVCCCLPWQDTPLHSASAGHPPASHMDALLCDAALCQCSVCATCDDTHTRSQVPEFVKLICKVFWSASFMRVPPLLLQPEQFQGWMMAFHTAMRKQLPWVRLAARVCCLSVCVCVCVCACGRACALALARAHVRARVRVRCGVACCVLYGARFAATTASNSNLALHAGVPTSASPHPCCASRTAMHAQQQDQAPADPADLHKWPWSKTLKWVLHNTYRLFNRCASSEESAAVAAACAAQSTWHPLVPRAHMCMALTRLSRPRVARTLHTRARGRVRCRQVWRAAAVRRQERRRVCKDV